MPAARKVAPVDEDAAIHFGAALAAAHRGEPPSLPMLDAAIEASLAGGDARGTLRATAARLVAGHDLGNFRGFAAHLARLAPLREGAVAWSDRDDELVALTGLVAGLILLAPGDAALDRAVDRVMALLEQDLDVNLRFAAGRVVLYYAEPREKRALSQRVYATLHPAMDAAALTPHRLAKFLTFWSRCARYAKDTAQAEAALVRARALAERHDLRQIRFVLAAIELERGEPERQTGAAESAVAALEALADPANLGEQLQLSFLRTRLARARGDGDAAVFHAVRACDYARELELPPPMHAVYVVSEAQARLAVDDVAAARDGLVRAAAMVPAAYADEVRDMLGIVDAYAATLAGASDARERMAQVWAKMRQRQFYDTFDGYPEFGARICALALDWGIETDFVANLIRMRRIAPPAHAPEAWPWVLRIHALGGLRVERDGRPLVFEGKSQKKPLELLKTLVALGTKGVAKQKLCDLLWPDADADASTAALDMTISRLRKLVGDADAIRVEDGKVALDERRVWIDVRAFDRDVDLLQEALGARAIDDARVADLAARLLARYRGPFLGHEDPQRWSLAARDRWQNRFRRSLVDAGRFWEQRRQWAAAIALYERGIEEDSLAEEIYRRLMHCHLTRGAPAEAARAYRRCRDMLSIQLGIRPSAETEALFRTIYAG